MPLSTIVNPRAAFVDPRQAVYTPGVTSEPVSSGVVTSAINAVAPSGFSAPAAPATLPTPPEFPEIPGLNIPQFVAPARDESRRLALVAQAASPGVTGLRRLVRQGQVKGGANKLVRDQATRQALKGMAAGLGNVISQAQLTGSQAYEQEYTPKYQEAVEAHQNLIRGLEAEQQQAAEQAQAEYQRAYDEYIRNLDNPTTPAAPVIPNSRNLPSDRGLPTNRF